MLSENLVMTGRLKIEVNGVTVKEVPNLVVTAGKEYVASRIDSNSKAVISHMAVGTGSTAPAAGNTTLGAEVLRKSLGSSTVVDNTITYVTTFAAGEATAALTEAGLFNASSGGDMLCRTTFSVVNKAADDTMTITWVVTVS